MNTRLLFLLKPGVTLQFLAAYCGKERPYPNAHADCEIVSL